MRSKSEIKRVSCQYSVQWSSRCILHIIIELAASLSLSHSISSLLLDVLTMHNTEHHVSFAQNIWDVHVIGMGTSMDNAIHIQVEMVKFRQKRRIRHDLVNLGIAFREPSVKLEKEGKRSWITIENMYMLCIIMHSVKSSQVMSSQDTVMVIFFITVSTATAELVLRLRSNGIGCFQPSDGKVIHHVSFSLQQKHLPLEHPCFRMFSASRINESL